ncbi:MAG: translation elongation factor Ts [Deltaproteobacteria bacterium]|nr:MAG: translation elongation factor Ts [Deltaproteobacteria bacterium]
MTEISAQLVKQLRDRTGAGFMDCKRALEQSGGNIEEAILILRKRGLAKAEKKAGRETADGLIGSYVHAGGKIGVLVEVNCETDFVARTEDFRNLVKEIAMQIAAMNPKYISPEDIPEEVLEREKEILREQARSTGKPEKVIERIVEGKLKKFYEENCLLEQPYIRDSNITVRELIAQTIAKLGENIRVRRFVRFQLNEPLE